MAGRRTACIHLQPESFSAFQSVSGLHRDRSKSVSMLGPEQVVVWADVPFPNNPFPAVDFENYGLAGENQSMFIYVPTRATMTNVREVEKKMSETIKGGRSNDLTIPQTAHLKKAERMQGRGADPIKAAFQHPVKVKVSSIVLSWRDITNLQLFRFPRSNWNTSSKREVLRPRETGRKSLLSVKKEATLQRQSLDRQPTAQRVRGGVQRRNVREEHRKSRNIS